MKQSRTQILAIAVLAGHLTAGCGQEAPIQAEVRSAPQPIVQAMPPTTKGPQAQVPSTKPQPQKPTAPTPAQVRAQRLNDLNGALKSGTFVNHGKAIVALNGLLDNHAPEAAGSKVADTLVSSAASLIDDEASWTSAQQGRELYDALKRLPSNQVVDSLVRSVTRTRRGRLHVLFLGVKLGLPGSEQKLNRVLRNHGDKRMAEDFLNSGSSELHQGGEQWAADRGYMINSGPGSHRTGWGDF